MTKIALAQNCAKAHKISASLHLPKCGLENLDLKLSAAKFYTRKRNFTRCDFRHGQAFHQRCGSEVTEVAVELARKATPVTSDP